MRMTRTLFGITACLLLAGCGAEPQTDSKRDSPTQPPATSMAADGGPSAGLYRATDKAGEILIEELRSDRTYEFRGEDGAIIEEGSYEQKSQTELCFTASAEGASEKCYSESLGEDRVWRSIDPETNAVYVIQRVQE